MLPEIQLYVERLQDRRTEILKTLDGLELAALDWRPAGPETNSLVVLAVHSVGSERRWIHQVIGGKSIERDRAAEFRARSEAINTLTALYTAAANETEQVLANLTAEDMEARRELPTRSCTVRWAILHVLEHYDEHLAHMGLTRQLWENRTTRPHEI